MSDSCWVDSSLQQQRRARVSGPKIIRNSPMFSPVGFVIVPDFRFVIGATGAASAVVAGCWDGKGRARYGCVRERSSDATSLTGVAFPIGKRGAQPHLSSRHLNDLFSLSRVRGANVPVCARSRGSE